MATSSETKVVADSTSNENLTSENTSNIAADSSTDVERDNPSNSTTTEEVPQVSTTSDENVLPDSNSETKHVKNADSHCKDSEISSSDDRPELVEKGTQDCNVDSTTSVIENETENFVDCDSTFEENRCSSEDHEILNSESVNPTVEINETKQFDNSISSSDKLDTVSDNVKEVTTNDEKSENLSKANDSLTSKISDDTLSEKPDDLEVTVGDSKCVADSNNSLEEDATDDSKVNKEKEKNDTINSTENILKDEMKRNEEEHVLDSPDTNLSLQEHVDTEIEQPIDTEIEQPVDTEIEQPVDTEIEKPADTEIEQPVGTEIEQPVDTEIEKPVDTEIEKPADTKIEQPLDTEIEQPIDTEIEHPVDTEIKQPVDTEIKQPVDTEIEQPIDTEIEQPLDTEIEQPLDTKIEQPVDTEIIQPVDTEIIQPVDTEIKQPENINEHDQIPGNEDESSEKVAEVETEEQGHRSGSDDEPGDELNESYEPLSHEDDENYSDEDLEDNAYSDEEYVIEKEYREGEESELEEGEIREKELEGGEEEVIDQDQDRRNPQFIPKKGEFYEHDDRLTEEPEGAEAKPKIPVPAAKNKKLWKESADSWGHDMFNEGDQGPKREQDLVNVYGYDIRQETGPPRARRRRKYGRGPNRYTRNWEDQEAYMPRGRGALRGGRGRGRGGFNHQNQNQDDDVRRSSESGTEEKVAPEENNSFDHTNFKNEFPALSESAGASRVLNGRGRPSNRRPVIKRGNSRNFNSDRKDEGYKNNISRTRETINEKPVRNIGVRGGTSGNRNLRGGSNSAPRTFTRSGERNQNSDQPNNFNRQQSNEKKYLPQDRSTAIQPSSEQQQQRKRYNPPVNSRSQPRKETPIRGNVRTAFDRKEKGESAALMEEVMKCLESLESLWGDFESGLGVTARLWSMYIDMMLILRRYIHAERAGLWQQHLQEVRNMLPYTIASGHSKYMSCLPIYLNEMQKLPETPPEVHEEFAAGKFTVHQTAGDFNGVWTNLAMAFIQPFNTLGSSTFGQLQERYRDKFLNMKPRHCTEVHFVGNQYDFELKSLKCDERQRRESNINLPEYVPADSMKIPDWKTLLSNSCNRTNMLSYLASRWSQEASWPAGFCLVLGVNAQATQTEHTDVDELYCPNHEEADTRIFAHIASCDDNNVFVIQTTDTDIIFLAMYHFPRLPNVVELWVEKNDLFLFIHDLVNELAKAVGKDVLALTDTLLISYILSSCNSVSYPFKRGKKRTVKVALEHVDKHPTLSNCIQHESGPFAHDQVITEARSFFCDLYGKPGYLSLDKLRAHLFASSKLDLRSLPPTEDAFHFHVLRSLCQICLYKQASFSNPVLLPPEEYGRIVDGDRLIHVMKSKPSKPSAAKL
ncbi:Protein CASC3 [Nymphon striatum]|nr:Protein CASC3 [Nymphon striatum]